MSELVKQILVNDYELVIYYSDNGCRKIQYSFSKESLKKEMNNVLGLISECLISNKTYIFEISLFFRKELIIHFIADGFCSYHCRK